MFLLQFSSCRQNVIDFCNIYLFMIEKNRFQSQKSKEFSLILLKNLQKNNSNSQLVKVAGCGGFARRSPTISCEA